MLVNTPILEAYNHYAVKSYEEFLAKRARGRARINTLRDFGYFDLYDLNDIEE